jgi:hypothetical protein
VIVDISKPQPSWNALMPLVVIAVLVAAIPALAQSSQSFGHDNFFQPGNLVVSRSVYDNLAGNVTVGEPLPPNCVATSGGCGGVAGFNGLFPFVFNNDADDGSFGITSRIFLDQITPFGFRLNSLEVPNSLQPEITPASDQLVTSFSSKSELALNLSTDGRYVTFMGYVAPVNQLDASASNTPLVVDPTNPVGEFIYRAVAQVDQFGNFLFTKTNAYSGDNGRAAIRAEANGTDFYYTAGNAGNGGNPEPTGIVLGAGAQILNPSSEPERLQVPGLPTLVGTFNVTDLGDKADKFGKDDNFRGMTIFNNVLYYSKGSGGNGVDSVYFVDTTGTACPNGVGLPSPSAVLPSAPDTAYNPTTGTPTNMCILAGFPTILAKNNTANFPLEYGSRTPPRFTLQTKATATSVERISTLMPPHNRMLDWRSGFSIHPQKRGI